MVYCYVYHIKIHDGNLWKCSKHRCKCCVLEYVFPIICTSIQANIFRMNRIIDGQSSCPPFNYIVNNYLPHLTQPRNPFRISRMLLLFFVQKLGKPTVVDKVIPNLPGEKQWFPLEFHFNQCIDHQTINDVSGKISTIAGKLLIFLNKYIILYL